MSLSLSPNSLYRQTTDCTEGGSLTGEHCISITLYVYDICVGVYEELYVYDICVGVYEELYFVSGHWNNMQYVFRKFYCSMLCKIWTSIDIFCGLFKTWTSIAICCGLFKTWTSIAICCGLFRPGLPLPYVVVYLDLDFHCHMLWSI